MVQITLLHTADELRQISNVAHVIEGVVLGAATLIALLQATGRLDTGRHRVLWPGLVLTAGTGLLFYLIVPHHGLSRARVQWSFVFRRSATTTAHRHRDINVGKRLADEPLANMP